ncbi:MAG: ABC-2 family transporter protein [Alphaproteobacteria bacterium]|nr:ABC-2 family transporter protein [Alphaproteobacteria bacterium]
MFKDIKGILDYIVLLVPAALRAATENRAAFWSLSFFMFLQNIIMFMIWVIYFDNFSNLRGWELADLATLYGLAAFAFGLAFLLCGGALDLGRSIVEGELDVHLGRPRHPLIGLLFRESRAAGVGDMITAPVIWLWFANYSPLELGILVLLGLFSALIILATALVINCLPFFAAQGSRMTDQLLESFIIISTYPHNGFGVGVKILLLTIIPAGFVAYLPIEAIRNFDIPQMALLGVAAVFYMSMAVIIFNRGLRRYTSGNKMLEVRQ